MSQGMAAAQLGMQAGSAIASTIINQLKRLRNFKKLRLHQFLIIININYEH